ncbi:MAG: response regulator [Muricoprocola sp.]
MNVRVMIVEDEPIIRKGIATVIPWRQLGCETPVLAENGEEGLKKAMETDPQLIISDIRMPQMDGLNMAEELRKRGVKAKIIFLTGYREFEYAQRGISYGVSDYILKPVDQDQLTVVVEKLVQEIQREESEENEWEKLKEKMEESIPILRDKFISSLLFHSADSVELICEKMEYFHIRLQTYTVFSIALDSFHDLEKSFTETDIQLLLFLITEQVEQIAERYGCSVITYQYQHTVYVIVSVTTKVNAETILELGKKIEEQVKEKGRFSVSIGISNIYEGAENMRKARTEADQCVAQRAFLGNGCVVCYHDLETMEIKHSLEEIETERFYEALRSGENVKETAEYLKTQIGRNRNLTILKTTMTELLSKSLRILIEIYGEDEELTKQYDICMEKIFLTRNVNGYEEIMLSFGIWADNYIQEKQVSRTDYLMNKAIRYMQENCRKEITLEEVAEQVYVSKWYLSKLFRKVKGEKFSDYLSKLKVEEAQRIIREHPDLKNYEVADMIGFHDVRYFSQLFKKISGKTPSEFRGQ